MRLIFNVLFICTLTNEVIQAQTLIIDAGPISRYMAHGVDVGLADQEAFQFGVYKPLRLGFNFIIWSSFDLDRKYENLDEVNLLLKMNFGLDLQLEKCCQQKNK